MVNRILVPLDGSKISESIVPYVSLVAHALHASMTLLHVAPPDGASDETLEPSYLQNIAEQLRQKDLQVETSITSGYPPMEIERYASENQYDLIAMATHGRSGVTRWVYGSITDKVLHTTHIPLLLVRPMGLEKIVMQGAGLQSLVVPLDGSKLAEEALPHAEALAVRMGLGITLIRVIPVMAMAHGSYESYTWDPGLEDNLETYAKKYVAGVQARLSARGFRVHALVVRGNPAAQIIDLARETEGSLVVMATHGSSGVSRWVVGSVADRVLRASYRPVFLIRSKTVDSAATGGHEAVAS